MFTTKKILTVAVLSLSGLGVGLVASNAAVDSESELPVQTVEYYEIFSDDVGELAARAEVVIIGELVRYDREVYEMLAEDEDVDKSSTILDGIVFKPIEVLKGEAPKELIVGTPVMLRGEDGIVTSRLVQPPIDVVNPGINAAKKNEASKTYLVFASEWPGAAGIYAFFSSGGVVEVLPGGQLTGGVAPPFVERPGGIPSAFGSTLDEIRIALAS